MTSHYTVESDIERDWSIISRTAADVLRSVAADLSLEPRLAPQMAEVQERRSVAADDDRKTAAVELIRRKRDRHHRRDFYLSLLLSNCSVCT